MKKIELESFHSNDPHHELPVGFAGPGSRDYPINFTLSEIMSDYQALTECYLTLASIGRDQDVSERIVELAARFRAKAHYWHKSNVNMVRQLTELEIAIRGLEAMADSLEKALTKRRQAA